MSYTTSTRLSKELLINNTHGCNRRHTRMVGKGRTYFVEVNISPRSLDAWSFHMLSGTRGPINPVHSRHNVFICQSVLTPGGGNDIPLLKSAAIVIARSSNALCGSPLVLKLIPAVCIIAFAAWGLGPLMCLSRIIFLHESEDSWKKSNTHYVVTSYVQPLLLWIGATHICSVLDPVILPSEASQAVKQRLLKFVRLSSFTLAFAYCLSSLIQQAQKFFTDTNDTDNARNMGFSLAGKAIYAAVWVAAVALFMELLGFPTQKWLTAGGFGTVLLTLAGREILTNFLSSIMIQAARPFALNEWIQTKIEGYEVSGTVEKVGWWSPTVIRGDDREANHIPNHKFTVSVVRNLSQKTHWRIKTHLAISHLDASKINNIVADMRKVLAKNPQIEQQRLHRRVFLDIINPESQALMILVSCFVKTSHFEEYLCVKEAVLMDLLRVVSHHRARLATPIRTIHKLYSEPDLENVPFADTIFTRPRATVNRPLLLIEPSYKINGDDKVKASIRLTHTSDGKDENVEAASPSDPKADVKPRSNPTPDFKEDKNMTTSTSNSNKNSKASATLTSDTPPPVPNSSEGLHPDGNAGYGLKETVRLNAEGLTSEGATAGKGFPTNLESGGGRSDSPSATSQSKQDAVARPHLEENIVLGVALDGSKRTLPIEDEVSPSPSSIESKELTSSRNGIGTSVGKDKKDGQTPTVPKTPQNDLRDYQS